MGFGWVALAAYYRGLAWLLIWVAIAYLVVSAAYARLGPEVFGKRVDGTLRWWAIIVLLPYLLLAWITWCVARLLSREPACQEVAPGLWIGRRPVAHEIPPAIGLVVDLTCELWEPRSVRKGWRYFCVPTLDATVPDAPVLNDIVRLIVATDKATLIHCAQGHGRSAAVAAATMVAKGIARDWAEAEERIRAVRPGVRMNAAQRCKSQAGQGASAP